MEGWIALVSATLCTVAAIAVTAVPAAAQSPGGQGLVDFGKLTREDIGEVSLFGPRGPLAGTGFLNMGEHLVATQLEVTFTEPEPFTLSKSHGQKAGLTTFTCTQSFDEPGGSGDLTLTVAVIPMH